MLKIMLLTFLVTPQGNVEFGTELNGNAPIEFSTFQECQDVALTASMMWPSEGYSQALYVCRQVKEVGA